MTIQYNYWLVIASIAVAILASYVGLSLASRVAVARGRLASRLWLAGGAVSMGIGIWSMHFVGMLAASLPIPMVYDVGWTLLSLLIAIVVSGFALFFVSRDMLGWRRLAMGGALLGTGIASMHYVGMEAVQIAPGIAYKPGLFALSVGIAISASCVALWLLFHLRSASADNFFWKRCSSAVVLGMAIAGMHYTGMAAASFAPGSICTAQAENINNVWLAATIAGFTVMMLGITLMGSLFDSHLINHGARHAKNLMALNEQLRREKLELGRANERLEREIGERIHEREKFESRIMRLNAELEERVWRRTAQLEAANRELEAFSYSVSHDLRAPLNTLDGFSQLLTQRAAHQLDAQSSHYLSRIRAGAQQMAALIEGMLCLAKFSRNPLRIVEVDLTALAKRFAAEYRETEPQRGATITVQEGLMAKGDAMLLQAVMQNLLGNAWKFTSRQSEARIVVGSEKAASGRPVYFVKDNGAGFDMAYAGKLFGTFQRLHSNDNFSGNGVGLAIVHRIITRHGGEIWAHAVEGEYAEFYFTLGAPDMREAGVCDDESSSARTL